MIQLHNDRQHANDARTPPTTLTGALSFFFFHRRVEKFTLKRKQTFSFKQFFFVSRIFLCVGVRWITIINASEQRLPANEKSTLFKLCQGRFVVGVNANYNRLMYDDIVFSFFCVLFRFDFHPMCRRGFTDFSTTHKNSLQRFCYVR